MDNFFKDKKVIITGGFGFIGSHLYKRLIQQNANIVIIDRGGSNKFRLKDYLNEIKLYEVDITDAEKLQKIIIEEKPEYVFHLAAYGVNAKDNNYIQAINTNIMGSINVLNALKYSGCEKIINMGTSSEYGNQKSKENKALKPTNIYGSTKASSTIMLHQIARNSEIDIVTLRPFNIFGEGEEPHKLFCEVIIKILQNEKVELTDCTQYRDYTYISNIIDGLLLAAENKSVKNQIFNIASGETHPLKYYVEKIFDISGTANKPFYGFIPQRTDERMRQTVDIKKIRKILNWKPKISLEQGIENTINWYKENLCEYVRGIYV